MARPPPLMALRALEAAVRHRSYSRAAAELNITHGAISHQIRRLEGDLGTPLFQRRGNGMEPLPVAAKLAVSVTEALALIGRAVDEAGQDRPDESLVISLEQGFARRWLTPRLMRLREETGERDLDIRVENRLAELVGDGVDAAVRYGDGAWPGLEAVPLFRVQLFPVCSHAFLAQHPIEKLGDLYDVPLLRHTHPIWSWPFWFRSFGAAEPPDRGMMFDDSSLMLEAAVEGAGVALARSLLVEGDLRTGRLLRPLGEEVQSAWSYFFVWRPNGPKQGRVLALRDWLLKAAVG